MEVPHSVAPATKKKSTLQSLTKIPGFSGLYRHDNGTYYGKKKIHGVKKVTALTTQDGANIADRKIAEKAFAAWVGRLEKPAPTEAAMPLADLLTKLKSLWKGKAESTFEKVDWVKNCLESYAPALLATPINAIKPSMLGEFFALRSKTLGACAFNEMSRIFKNAFELAIGDDILLSNPYAKIPKGSRRMKIKRVRADVPTIEQCEAIVNHIRQQRCFRHDVNASADMLAFMHLAAIGSAECVNAEWSDVKWDKNLIQVKRQKTGAYFVIPIYDHLKPFLVSMHTRKGKPTTGKLFSIKSPKQALINACKRLDLKPYSPIDFRKARIVWMLRKGVRDETIAKWQGHSDNGILIRKTYSWVKTETDMAYEIEQLAKLSPPTEGKLLALIKSMG